MRNSQPLWKDFFAENRRLAWPLRLGQAALFALLISMAWTISFIFKFVPPPAPREGEHEHE